MARANGRHNLHVLQKALELNAAGSAGTKSRNEDAFLSMIKDLPQLLVNTKLNGEEADFHWPADKLVVEVDGSGHDRPRTKAEDARKEATWRAVGYSVLRLHYRAITAPSPARGDSSPCQHRLELKGFTMKKIKILATSAALTLPVILPTVAQAKATWT